MHRQIQLGPAATQEPATSATSQATLHSPSIRLLRRFLSAPRCKHFLPPSGNRFPSTPALLLRGLISTYIYARVLESLQSHKLESEQRMVQQTATKRRRQVGAAVVSLRSAGRARASTLRQRQRRDRGGNCRQQGAAPQYPACQSTSSSRGGGAPVSTHSLQQRVAGARRGSRPSAHSTPPPHTYTTHTNPTPTLTPPKATARPPRLPPTWHPAFVPPPLLPKSSPQPRPPPPPQPPPLTNTHTHTHTHTPPPPTRPYLLLSICATAVSMLVMEETCGKTRTRGWAHRREEAGRGSGSNTSRMAEASCGTRQGVGGRGPGLLGSLVV